MANLIQVRDDARKLMDDNGLQAWNLKFNRARNQAGCCRRPTSRLPGEIRLSAVLFDLWEYEHCLDTILHEIAHALTTGGHDAEWRRVFTALGGSGEVLWSEKADQPRPPSKYTGTCPLGHTIGRQRLPRTDMSCVHCNRRFDRRFLFTWTQNF